MSTSIQLRPYQRAAADAAMDPLSGDTVICAPTGSGKTLIQADVIARESAAGARILAVTHRKELIAQNFETACRYAPDKADDMGINSAGLGRRDTDERTLFCGIGSIARNFDALGRRDLILVDEAHRTNQSAGMYADLFSHFSGARKIGLTATPYRLDGGLIYGADKAFQTLGYQIFARQLVDDGFLAPLAGRRAAAEIDVGKCRIRTGEYATGDLEQAAMDQALIEKSVAEMIANTSERGGEPARGRILVFCISVAHVEAIHAELLRSGESSAAYIHGGISDQDRSRRIDAFKSGDLRWLINCEILTTGFDCPALDCICLLRPTASKSLHVQMLGRGMRKAHGKTECLVLDFAGNCARHGDIDLSPMQLPPTPEAEKSDREKERKEGKGRKIDHFGHVIDGDPMRGNGDALTVPVIGIRYLIEPARKQAGKFNVVAVYDTYLGKIRKWLFPEYDSGAKWFAIQYLSIRGIARYAVPSDAARFAEICRRSPIPEEITVRKQMDSGYYQVEMEHFACHDPIYDAIED